MLFGFWTIEQNIFCGTNCIIELGTNGSEPYSVVILIGDKVVILIIEHD